MLIGARYALVLLLVLALSLNSFGIGIGMFRDEVAFEPNLNVNIQAFVNNNMGGDIRVRLVADGLLAEYVTLSDEFLDIPAGQRKSFSFNLKLPATIPPGRNRIDIGAEEYPASSSGGITSITSVFKDFYIVGPYKGKYLQVEFPSPDVFLGKEASFKVDITHLGDEPIDRVSGSVTIFKESFDGPEVITLPLSTISNLEPKETRTAYATWKIGNLTVGDYAANATLFYDNTFRHAGVTFRVGDFSLRLINYTSTAVNSGIQRLDFEVESFWNERVDGVYGEFFLDNIVIRATPISIGPWGRGKLTMYLDTSLLQLKRFESALKLYYKSREFSYHTPLTIIPKPLELSPSKLSPVMLVLIGVAFLTIINMAVALIYFWRRNTNGPKRSKQTRRTPKPARKK